VEEEEEKKKEKKESRAAAEKNTIQDQVSTAFTKVGTVTVH
jgi:hypothetical protein